MSLRIPLFFLIAAFLSAGCDSFDHDDDRAGYPPQPAADGASTWPPQQDSKEGVLSGTLEIAEVTSASASATASAASASTRPAAAPAELLPIRRTLQRALVTDAAGHFRVPAEAKAKAGATPAQSEELSGRLIVRFEQGELTPAQVLERLKLEGYALQYASNGSPFLHLVRMTHADGRPLTLGETRELAQRVRQLPGVRFVELDRTLHAFAVPNDSYYPYQWHLPLMNLPAAWDLTRGSPSIVVADLDTGVLAHPDLQANLLPGYDFISDSSRAQDGDGRDADPTDEGGDAPNGGSTWHGLHTAGTIAAISGNSDGVAGVAPGVKLLPVRALGNGGGTLFDLASAVYWAAGGSISGVPANTHPARVINMSLGGAGAPTQTYQDAIDYAVAAGCVVVVAAGNDDEPASGHTPCNQEHVICVGAVRYDGTRSSYSNYGSAVDVMAPGGDSSLDQNGDSYPDGVLSTYAHQSGSPTYEFLQGTSMATPHITGLVALMLSVNPSLSAAQIESLLKSTANSAYQCDLGCGAGLVDAFAAVQAAKGQSSSAPAKLGVGSTGITVHGTEPFTIALSNLGSQTLNVTATTTGALAERIELTGSTSLSIPGGKSAALQASVNSSGLANGDYAGAIQLGSNGGSATVFVTLKLGESASASKEAVVAAVYQDSKGEWQVGGATRSEPAQGQAWKLAVPANTYYVLASVDTDGDGQYFEDAEPLGFYKSVDHPVEVELAAGQSVSGLSFQVLPRKGLETSGPSVGDPCSADASCPAGGGCVTQWPGGYCSQDCSSTGCAQGSVCVAVNQEEAYCLASCSAPGTQSTCRSGYACLELESGGGICAPQQ